MLNSKRDFLNKNTHVMFTYANKGNNTVFITKSDYKSEILDSLNDKNNYIELDSNSLEKLQKDTADIYTQ